VVYRAVTKFHFCYEEAWTGDMRGEPVIYHFNKLLALSFNLPVTGNLLQDVESACPIVNGRSTYQAQCRSKGKHPAFSIAARLSHCLPIIANLTKTYFTYK
jgi:hypothetical protein